jgi:hypothetical protein
MDNIGSCHEGGSAQKCRVTRGFSRAGIGCSALMDICTIWSCSHQQRGEAVLHGHPADEAGGSKRSPATGHAHLHHV